MNDTRIGLSALTALLCIAGLTACGTAPQAAPAAVELTLFHIDGGAELDPAVDWFADAVAEASDGRVTVEVIRGCCEDTVDIEEDLIAQVSRGGADLGWVGVRAFEGLGVAAMLPLTAPLLIDGYALQEAVLESEAARAALTELSSADVSGIALVPGQIRRPLAVAAPLLGLDDWAGTPIASFHSAQSARTFEAFGADPHDVSFAQRDIGIQDRSLVALENSLTMQDLDREETLPYATTNVALWPRLSAVIAAPGSPATTDSGVRAVLTEAAASVVSRTTEFVERDQDAIESACQSGARFAAASGPQLDTLLAAVAPVWDALAESEDTAALFTTISELRAVHRPETLAIPEGCDGDAPAVAASESSGDLSVVNGRWSSPTFSYDELVAAGFTEQDARNAEGVFVLAFDDGLFELEATAPSGDVFGCVGTYTVVEGRLRVEYRAGGDCGPGGVFFTADFDVDSAQLSLTNMADALESDEFLFSSAPLTKID